MDKVFVAECRSYSPAEVYQATLRLFEALDCQHLFKPGEKVLIKPNFLIPSGDDQPITTHSQVLLALSRLLLDCGCRVAVGDSPGMGSLSACITRKGLAEPLGRLGVPVVEFTNSVSRPLPGGRVVKKVPVAKEILEFDAVISAAKLKTHCQCYFTGSVKNLYGCLPGILKPEYHMRFAGREHFSLFLLDVHDVIKPRLGFIDGVVGMEGEGPSGGKAKSAGFLAAATDCPALDIAAMKIVSLNPALTIYLQERLARGGCETVKFGKVGSVVFEPPLQMSSISSTIPLPNPLKKILKFLTVPIPVFAKRPVCKLCGNCQKICPGQPKALVMGSRGIVFKRAYCIQCYCCHEMCPHKAIRLSRPVLMRLWRRIKVPHLRV
ncbi:MAG: hypothetical protein COX46_01850 [bacterium (Candidatus Ratteibacteria) CG23_combo_of_CG06-09_8_20_14_all_48_7]|uniref:4Fe-4S ferredoxin-type domain-containing protein n=1 Tax=bacterium (Candidatus Ratteibacteria) CG23_combo_of_CG06-09_8_20_14_all_48_7 TaxID=2014292 RepID=A0A2G9YDA0_9BACT|nr:MAG: hypothetical protein COX46_01850 [bacterium (Candidatus Ratteibacteria) CG23_combo_of_CG06-09_8_20_14_all_48_7]